MTKFNLLVRINKSLNNRENGREGERKILSWRKLVQEFSKKFYFYIRHSFFFVTIYIRHSIKPC
jgi:hypothetical protein